MLGELDFAGDLALHEVPPGQSECLYLAGGWPHGPGERPGPEKGFGSLSIDGDGRWEERGAAGVWCHRG